MPREPQSSALLAGNPKRKVQRVGQQRIAHPVHGLEKCQRHAVDLRHGGEAVFLRQPDERFRGGEIGRGQRRRR